MIRRVGEPNIVNQLTDIVKWDELPEWSAYYCVDSDGERWIFENMPVSKFNDYGVLYWDYKVECPANKDIAPGYGLDSYWYHIFTRKQILHLNRIYDDGNYLLIIDSTNTSKWFIIYEYDTKYDDYIEISAYYRSEDALERLWNLVKNSKI